jgi:hypothetical protein
MGLRNIVIHRETVVVDENQTFDVRGISLFDIMQVIGDFGPQMSIAFGKITARDPGDELDAGTVKERIKDLAKEFPDLLAAVIALASDDYSTEAIKIAKQLPMIAQVSAIETIFGLTFRSEAEVGKLVESLIRAMASATGALNTTDLSSLRGIGGSVVN